MSSLPAAAQFNSFSTTYDGSVLFFTTPLAQTGTGQPNHGKVFLADARGIRPLLIREREVFDGYFNGVPAHTTNFYDLVAVSAAGDISQLAITGLGECEGYTAGLCGFPDLTNVYNARGENIFTTNGHVTVSRNGKWGLVTKDRLTGNPAASTIVDLVTLKQYTGPTIQSILDWRQQGIADDGTAMLAGGSQLLIFRPPDIVQTMSNARTASAAIDAGATTIVWRDSALRAAKLGAMVSPPILLAEDGYEPQISADGALVLFRAVATGSGVSQIFVIRSDGSGRRQATNEPEGIQSAVLSGNGATSWMVTNTGKLIQLDLISGARREFIGPVPCVLDAPFIPGRKPGLGRVAAAGELITAPASVRAGDQVTARVGGFPAPVLAVQNGAVTLEVPWEVAPGNMYGIALSGPRDTGWTGSTGSLRAEKILPRFLKVGNTALVAAAHELFDAPVTEQKPAHPGEIVHLYGTGFGPVSPSVPTGTPAPSSPLSTTTTPMICFVINGNDPEIPATVLYSGLAPLTIGAHQVDVRLPDSLSPSTYPISCDLPGWSIGYSRFTALLPVQ